jgi:hypothetical protein
MLQKLHKASSLIGLQMNLSKTRVMCPKQLQTTMDNQALENVSEYIHINIYLGHKMQSGKENLNCRNFAKEGTLLGSIW